MRLFFAVELPPEVQAALRRLRPSDAESRDYRWSDAAQLHVTLAFLGQQPEDRLAALRDVGTAAAAMSRPGILKLDQLGSFGPRHAPRVLWIDLSGDVAALQALQSSLATGLKQAGFALEDRPFRPHITLARRRESARGGAPTEWRPTTAPIKDGEFPMQALTLFESRLSPRGATYIRQGEFPLSVDGDGDEPYSAAYSQRR
jgi:2'-5' RNA ligase